MNPLVLTTVAGDLTTKWRRIAVVIIFQPVEVATHLHMHTGPRRLPTRCHLFRRIRVLVAHDHVLVARDHVEARPDKDLITGQRYRQGLRELFEKRP